MSQARYLLFIGDNALGARAEIRLRAYLVDAHGDDFDLQVVDVRREPELGDKHRVLATPCLIRQLPLPQRRLIGIPDSAARLAEVMGVTWSQALGDLRTDANGEDS